MKSATRRRQLRRTPCLALMQSILQITFAKQFVFGRRWLMVAAMTVSLVPAAAVDVQSPFPMVVKDALQRTIRIERLPERVVSLAPNITEIVAAIGCQQKLVGITDFCNYPPEITALPRVGGFVQPSVEKVVELHPDLVIATADGNEAAPILMLERAGCAIFCINPKNLTEVMQTIATIGELLGCQSGATQCVETMQTKLREVAAHVTKNRESVPKVLVQLGINPLISAGEHTFADDLIKLAGGSNICAALPVRYPRVNREFVLSQRPDLIIVLHSDDETLNLEEYWRQTGGDSIPAVRNHHIYKVDADLVTRPGPRLIAGLDAIAALIQKVTHSD